MSNKMIAVDNSTDIGIQGLNKEQLLVELYKRARPRVWGYPTSITLDQAKTAIERNKSLDFVDLGGRNMNVSIAGKTLTTEFYDRHNGEGTAKAAVEAVRASMSMTQRIRSKLHLRAG